MMATAAPAQRTRESSYAEVRDLYLSRDIRLLRTEDRDPTRMNPIHLVCVHLNKGYYLEGRIDVANIAFEKDVSLHVSWNNWQTSQDIAATYISSHENSRNAEIAALQDAASRTARTIEAPLNDEDVGGYARRATLQGTLEEAGVEKQQPPTPEPPVDRFFFRLHLLPFLRSASGAGHVTHLEFQLCAKFSAPAVGREWWDSNYGANYRCTVSL
ncbi:carbohydrate-binding module family 21 protein [Gonapodya prolifera JEL478]|uniref:Carbohydrate-binding module family 21 protein n=1 Tax=Gonapodya prolifera (strain JEL478) TaxID=1344416 RepID=A0A139AG44_GONPJ|nr:carbohydrate-binding module family 21 protein [Gonapodya prolifera JEL478]|eukprot:KXS15766.1 carbohydrate-binding module family 21 protein [Gonapodya prolifera JEL478]